MSPVSQAMYKVSDLIRITEPITSHFNRRLDYLDRRLTYILINLSFDQKNRNVSDVIIKMYVTNVIIS